MTKIQIKRGLKANLPVLDTGELALCTDTNELFSGTDAGNRLMNNPIFNTLADLQAAYPNGVNVPAWVVADQNWYYWQGSVADTTPPVVTATPNGGIFGTSQNVTLSTEAGATIYYTTDGSTPTYPISGTTQTYSAPISISANTTLKYIGRDAAGNVSAVQSAVFTKDATAPTDVTNLTVSNLASTTLTLSWNTSASSDIASYDVYKGATLLGNVTGTTYNVSGLTASTAYTFTVKAKDAVNNVSVGTSVNTTTSAVADVTAPNNVTNLTTSNITSTGVTLSWTASSSGDTTGYDVYNGATFVASTASTTYTVSGLTASTSYTFWIKAKDGANNIASGTSVGVTTIASADVTPPLEVTNLAATTRTDNSITVGWTASTSSDIASYDLTILEVPPPVASYLSLNGTSDYIKTAGFSYNRIVMDTSITSAAQWSILMYGTSGLAKDASGNMNFNSDYSSVLLNGSTATSGSTVFPMNTRTTFDITLATAFSGTFYLFSTWSLATAQMMGGKCYDIKLYNGATLVAHYDMTTGNVNDTSGQGHNATLVGGTWV
jgi:chitodextrinase